MIAAELREQMKKAKDWQVLLAVARTISGNGFTETERAQLWSAYYTRAHELNKRRPI